MISTNQILRFSLLFFTFFPFSGKSQVNNTKTQTQGALTFSFTPTAHLGYSGTKNVLAVWIQTASGTFVKTKIRNVGWNTRDHLPTWASNAGGSSWNALSGCNTTDATTGATLTSFTHKTVVWDGKNVNGTQNGGTVSDGTYKITIQETWNHNGGTALRSFYFTKGPNIDSQTPPSGANFTNISLTWTPGATGIESIHEKPSFSVFPNPTNGLIHVNYQSSSQIKITNGIGKIIYNQKVGQLNGMKTIDLSEFANGIYNVMIENKNGISIKKIILIK